MDIPYRKLNEAPKASDHEVCVKAVPERSPVRIWAEGLVSFKEQDLKKKILYFFMVKINIADPKNGFKSTYYVLIRAEDGKLYLDSPLRKDSSIKIGSLSDVRYSQEKGVVSQGTSHYSSKLQKLIFWQNISMGEITEKGFESVVNIPKSLELSIKNYDSRARLEYLDPVNNGVDSWFGGGGWVD